MEFAARTVRSSPAVNIYPLGALAASLAMHRIHSLLHSATDRAWEHAMQVLRTSSVGYVFKTMYGDQDRIITCWGVAPAPRIGVVDR